LSPAPSAVAIGARQKSMALEYDFYGEADVSVEELASLIAGALRGVVIRDDEAKGKIGIECCAIAWMVPFTALGQVMTSMRRQEFSTSHSGSV